MSKDYAKKHSMDISHVAAVELPLVVKNTDKAITMLGGKDRIKRALDSQYKPQPIQPSSHSVDDKNLELRLRDDPFHHPIQASFNRREKILLKVSIPKSSLPSDYYDNPQKYSIRDLIGKNSTTSAPSHKVEPVAIINKNYTFRAIADFQMSTKNNQTVQEFNNNILNVRKYEDLEKYYKEKLEVKDDFKDPLNYENKVHNFIPPPHFSGIRFPFDFKYQKSPYTVTLRDSNGDVKVVMKSDSKKLFTNTVDYYGDSVPQYPLPEIIKNYNWLLKSDLSQEYADKKLFDCIQHLTMLFEVKPIWLRKLLIDATPGSLKSAVKEALPYVSYCYKNGPWRFCNVKLGVNPKDDPSYWIYQSEYFRLQRHSKTDGRDSGVRIVPNTIKIASNRTDIKLSEDLFFTGLRLPRAINYQIGDIMDADVLRVIEKAQQKEKFFRESVDSQDGWVQRQVVETIRRIVRYKLRRLQKEEAIDSDKVEKIITTDYTAKANEGIGKEEAEDEEEDDNDAIANQEEDDGGENDENDEYEENDENEENDADDDTTGTPAFNEEALFHRIKEVDPQTANKINSLVGLIKQDSIDQA